MGTNFANDYYDARKGADTDEREGFTRVTQAGLISPNTVRRAMYLTYAAAIAVGVYLVYVGGVPILVVGLSSVAAGILYTGGPYPYGYRGLGDLFVFLYFGVVAVAGTYYVQAAARLAEPLSVGIPPDTLPLAAVVAGLAPAGLATSILVVNNIRDRETDARAGKRTLAVLLGYRGSRIEFLLLLGLAYAVPIVFAATGYGLLTLLPLVTLPLAAGVSRTLLTETGPVLNETLKRTGKLLAAHSLLFAAGLAAPALSGVV